MRKLFLLLALFACVAAHSEDGSRLWLRYDTVGRAKVDVQAPQRSATVQIAAEELRRYWKGGGVVLRKSADGFAGKPEGSFRIDGAGRRSRVTAATDIGLLYGAYELLRRQEAGMPAGYWADEQSPRFGLRVLNHWDNLDGSVERGYAGESIFRWFSLDTARLTEYARANASVGINGAVLNNVNASPKILTAAYLDEVRKIADLFRPYGIRVYLSVNFASPMALGDVKTADPLNADVARWWQEKAAEIYRLIPDFGGFLVKANSEGQPGPGDYGRSHADGANMLAGALRPYGGTVIWRSFVYGANHKGEDRVKQAVSEFEPCNGRFAPNVILQSKNGPLDFQPREPYAPIFDRIRATPQMAELQITQEYTGQSRHLVFLAPMWKEFFSFVAPSALVGVAGVANTGSGANWCGHHFSQANWYAFGRLAWNPDLGAEDIAREWIGQTFTRDTAFVSPVAEMMMTSREACVDYMMPLGLHHIFKFDHHYGPEPDGFKAEYPIEWCPVYYHKADSAGIGFDRTVATGSGATAQYREPYASLYEDVSRCPEEYLLWFHHLPWDYRMRDGGTLWESLCRHYDRGVAVAASYAGTWRALRQYVDGRRWQEVDSLLGAQAENAAEWRDVCLGYFSSLCGRQPVRTSAPEVSLRRDGTRACVTVGGTPMLILGGELSNSAATCVADIDSVMPRMKAIGLNTVLVPAYWELMEPEEGRFDFTLIDETIKEARRNGLKVVFLWFGAWKNSMSCYAPLWFKQDTERFPRAMTRSGKPLEIASAFSENVFQADRKAFTALMRHIKAVDSGVNTVIMVQVENEIGMLEDARDHSPLAEKAYKSPIPSDFAKAMGVKATGSWADVLPHDDYGDEQFMAYYYAKYVERLAKEARAIHDIPLYVNAAMNSRGRKPGEYPSAGPLAHLKDIWHCAAPDIDLLAPDIYDTGFKDWAGQYALPDNPVFIPESRCCADSGVRALYVFGEHEAVGFSPFAIDQSAGRDTREVGKAYSLVRSLEPLLLKHRGTGAVRGVLFSKDDKETVINDGRLTLTCRHYFTLPWDSRATDGSPWREGGAVIIRLAEDEYIVAGSGVVVVFQTAEEKSQEQGKVLGEDGFAAKGAGVSAGVSKRFSGRRAGIGYVDEIAVNGDGTLKYLRRLNGDQDHQGRHVRISVDEYRILHVKLYEY